MKWYLWAGVVGGFLAGQTGALKAASAQENSLQTLASHMLDVQRDLHELMERLERLEQRVGQGPKSDRPAPSDALLPVTPARESVKQPAKVLKDTPETVVKYNKALDLLQSNQLQDALFAFRTFEREHPKSPLRESALYWIGVIYFSQRNTSEALETFQSLLHEYPASLQKGAVLLKLAKLYQSRGEGERACEMLAAFESLPQKGADAKTSQKLSDDGRVLMQQLGCAPGPGS